jgi:transcriptional regulator with XRE-family HTH domain
MATLSEILKTKITKDGISKAYVASELGVGERTIEYYMSGQREPDLAGLIKLSNLLGFQLNELSEQSVRGPNYDQKGNKQNGKNDNSGYVALLESNDKFFKHEYAQMLLSLNKLIDLGKRSEALIKLNLEHTGNVEALQRGVDPEVIHEQINNQIADMGPSDEKGNDVDN